MGVNHISVIKRDAFFNAQMSKIYLRNFSDLGFMCIEASVIKI